MSSRRPHMRLSSNSRHPLRLLAAAAAGCLLTLGLTAPPAAAAPTIPTAQTNRAYVANSGSNTVSVLDAVSHAVVATIPVGQQPSGVAVNAAGTRAYATNRADGTVSVIDTSTNAVVATVT